MKHGSQNRREMVHHGSREICELWKNVNHKKIHITCEPNYCEPNLCEPKIIGSQPKKFT